MVIISSCEAAFPIFCATNATIGIIIAPNYNVHLVNYDIPLDGVFHGYDGLDDKRIDLDFCWVPLEDLKNDVKVYPQELVPYILEPKKEIVHFVSKQI